MAWPSRKVREAHVGLVVLGHVLRLFIQVRKRGKRSRWTRFTEEVIGVAEALADERPHARFCEDVDGRLVEQGRGHLAGDDRFQMRV